MYRGRDRTSESGRVVIIIDADASLMRAGRKSANCGVLGRGASAKSRSDDCGIQRTCVRFKYAVVTNS